MKKVALFLLVALFGVSCGRITYPKERLAESLIELCKREYQIDVKAQLKQTTIGVFVVVPGLVEELMRRAAEASRAEGPSPVAVDGDYMDKKFRFQFLARGPFARVDSNRQNALPRRPPERKRSKPMTVLDNVSNAIRRVALSTDAPIEFYTLIARDPGPTHFDIIFSGHLFDLKRVLYYDISIGELERRSRAGARPHPEALARQTVSAFLRDLSRRPLPQILSRYAAPSKRYGDLLPGVLELAVDLESRRGVLHPEEWPTLQTEREEVLVLLPAGSGKDWLISVSLGEPNATLLEITRWDPLRLPERYGSLPPSEKWNDSFYLEPLSLPQFLTEQIARRVSSEFQAVEENPAKGSSSGERVSNDVIARVLLETSAYVLSSYRFTGFQRVEMTDLLKGTRWEIPSGDLPLYRRRNPPEPKPVLP
ncbi:MAG: hypothetical protein HYZ90_06490 [Candidatus Omnitrophica bacterium]|nr:hypothetical protein [Candidatus Omnitrophota bacterium]